MLRIVALSCLIAIASAGFLASYSPYSHALPAYVAPLATSYSNTYRISHSVPVIKTYAAPLVVPSYSHGLDYHGYHGYLLGGYHH